MNGVDVWPYIRITLGFKLLSTPTPIDNNIIDDNKDRLQKLSELICQKEGVDAFILFDSFTRIKLNNKWYNRLSTPFYDELKKMGLNVVNLEFSNHNIERFPVYDEAYSISNQLEYIKNIRQLKSVSELEGFEDIKQEFYKQLGENFEFPSLASINKDTLYINQLSNYFETLFINKKTKIAMMINFYQPNSYAYILAARNAGIPSVDIQHGNQRDIFYHKWVNVPRDGYNILPSHFWCWDKKDIIPIIEWTSKSNAHQAINGGNPWIELWKDTNNSLVKEYQKKMEKVYNKQKINILVTLQPRYGLADWKCNIPNWLLQAIKRSPDNWKWHIRYHPQMLGNYRNEMENCEQLLATFIEIGKVETRIATKEPLMAILRNMDVHITPFSTSVIEAMHLKVPSLTIHPRANLYFKTEMELGLVKQAETTEEIIEFINEFIFKKKNNDLPVIKSESIGLRKGLEVILNSKVKKEMNQNNINYSLIELEIYYADKQFHRIVDKYENNSLNIFGFIAGQAYEQLGQVEKAQASYYDYLNYLFELPNRSEIIIEQLLKIYLFSKSNKYESLKHDVEKFIKKLLAGYENFKLNLLMNIFHNPSYIEFIKWIDLSRENLDDMYFGGRIYLNIGDNENAEFCLINYLKCFSYEDSYYITAQKNYKVSAHFYLGEIYLKLENKNLAKYHFEKCNILTHGEHMKARQYLDKFS